MTWLTRAEQAARNERIYELWSMGYDRQTIAAWVDVTPQRVSQIIADFGCTFRGGGAEANSS